MPARTPAVAALAFGAGLCAVLAHAAQPPAETPPDAPAPTDAPASAPAPRQSMVQRYNERFGKHPRRHGWQSYVEAAKLWTDGWNAATAGKEPDAEGNGPVPDTSDPAWQEARRNALHRVRWAASMQYSGAPFSATMPPEWAQAIGAPAPEPRHDALLVETIPAHIELMMVWCDALFDDVTAAVEAGRGDDAFEPLSTLLLLANQHAYGPHWVEQMAGFRLFEHTAAGFRVLLHDHPDAFPDATLAALAELFAKTTDDPPLRISTRFIEDCVLDVFDHALASDAPDAKLTPDGWRRIMQFGPNLSDTSVADEATRWILAHAAVCAACKPVAAELRERGGSDEEVANSLFVRKSATRSVLMRYAHVYTGHLSAASYAPMAADPLPPLIENINLMRGMPPLATLSFSMIDGKTAPLFLVAPRVAERELHATRLAIAVQRYVRANQSYPQSLADLVPQFLSAVPIDSWSDAPYGYRITDDGVIIYSAGVDLDDDAGRPADDQGRPFPAEEDWEMLPPAQRPDGDYVMWPPSPWARSDINDAPQN